MDRNLYPYPYPLVEIRIRTHRILNVYQVSVGFIIPHVKTTLNNQFNESNTIYTYSKLIFNKYLR
jgi:hypothetical protein